MVPIDPDVAQAVVAALGYAGRDDAPADLAASAQAVTDAAEATRLDGGGVVLAACQVIRAVRAQPGPPTASAARRALDGRAWLIKDCADLTAVACCLAVVAASAVTEADLATIETIGREIE